MMKAPALFDEPPERLRSILVVDDSRTNLTVMGQRLGQRGYLAVLCGSGREALDLIGGRGFDLVLLDCVMPDLSGLDILAQLRGTNSTADLPVIMITAQSDDACAIHALEGGADDYLAKPFDFDVLFARIERTLARATRLADLKRSMTAMDARIAARAIELGEARTELAVTRADRDRLAHSLRRLNAQVERLSGTSVA